MSDCWFEKMCKMAAKAKGHFITLNAARLGIAAYYARFFYRFLFDRLGCRKRGVMRIKAVCPVSAVREICKNYLEMIGFTEDQGA